MRDMDAVFRALSDPARRRLLDRLNERNGLTLTELCADMGMTRQSVSKHLDVLEAADLVTTLRRGREKLHYLNAAPINDIADRWIHHYDRARAEALSDLKTALEATPMDSSTRRPSSTPPTSTPRPSGSGRGSPTRPSPKRYWRHPTSGGVSLRVRLEEGLDLRRGLRRGRARHQRPRAGDPRVRPLPPARLHLAHLHARVGGARTASTRQRPPPGGPSPARRSPSTSRRPATGVVKLTVVHDGFEPGSGVLEGVSHGGPPSWPA